MYFTNVAKEKENNDLDLKQLEKFKLVFKYIKMFIYMRSFSLNYLLK